MCSTAQKLAEGLLIEMLGPGIEEDEEFLDWAQDIAPQCQQILDGRDWFPESRKIPLMIEFIKAERSSDYWGDPELETRCATFCGNFIRTEGV